MNTIKNWQGIKSIKGKRIVSMPEVGKTIGLGSGDYYTVNSRSQALQMVLKKRFDFYIDDEKVMQSTIQTFQGLFDRDKYRVETIFSTGFYMTSPNMEKKSQ